MMATGIHQEGKMRVAILLLTGTLLGGCSWLTSEPAPEACTLSMEPGVSIKVFDQSNGKPITCGAYIRLIDGDYVEEIRSLEQLDCNPAFPLVGALERPGTYQVMIEQQQYQPWQGEVTVTAGACHVQTQQLDAHLTPY